MMTPDELCATYRAELARLYGSERAGKSWVYYDYGWYYINIAKRFDDGSIGVIGPANAYRKKQVLKMIEDLQERKSND